MSNLR